MYRVSPEAVHADPFGSLPEAQNAHLELVEQARKIEEKYGNALPSEDRGAAIELTQLRRRIRYFEWRLTATGARLPDDAQRSFAQSLLDFWSLQQADLRGLSSKFLARAHRTSRGVRPSAASGCLLLPYDEKTGAEAANHAEAIFEALPDDSAKQAAGDALAQLALANPLSPEAQAALRPFVAGGVIVEQAEASYSFAHPALPTAWARLSEWIANARQRQSELDRLKVDAEAWEKSGSAAELPRGEILDRAVRYSERDKTLTKYVTAAQTRRSIERGILIFVGCLIVTLLVLVFWSTFTRPSSQQAAAGRVAEVSGQIAQSEEIANVAASSVPSGDAGANGLSGWIWVGSSDDPKVQGQNGQSLAVDTIKAGQSVRTLSNLKVRNDKPSDNGLNIAGPRQAGVSAGSVGIALQDSSAISVRGTSQYWLNVQFVPLVFIQLDRTSELPVERLRKALSDNKFMVPPPERLPNIARPGASPAFDVRYYYEQDQPAAQRVAQVVARELGSGPPPPLTPLVNSALAQRVKTGTIEVWLYQEGSTSSAGGNHGQ